MIRIEFDDSLYTGDSEVDSQHRTLIGMFNELHLAATEGRGPETVGPILDRLHAYTIEHFAAEQRFMVDSRFPADEMLEHFREHSALTQRVRDLIIEYRSGGMATVLPLATLLQDWLTTHIRQMDRRVAEHFRSVSFVTG